MLTCLDVANYFLVLVDRNAGDSITQLKLQKLVYFAQGTNLALFDEPLFYESIHAWQYGPVVIELYQELQAFKKDAIPAPSVIDFELYNQREKELIYKIYSSYGKYSASYLLELTHQHSIWSDTFNNKSTKSISNYFDFSVEDKSVITKEKMQEYFKYLNKIPTLSLSDIEKQSILNAEDEWWMNYDSGVPSEDITDEILKSMQELEEGKGLEYNLV